jgi:outer membrane protein assembly factor BamB
VIRAHKCSMMVARTAFIVCVAITTSVAAEEPQAAAAEKAAQPGQVLGSFMTGGQIWSSPVHHGGAVYIGSVESSGVYEDGVLYMGSSDALTLFAFDGATGRVTWKYQTGGWSWCTPSISGETTYIGSISAFPYYFEGVTLERGLHAADLKTGSARWVVPTGKLPGFVTGGVMSTPLVVDGKVIAGALDNRLIVVAE